GGIMDAPPLRGSEIEQLRTRSNSGLFRSPLLHQVRIRFPILAHSREQSLSTNSSDELARAGLPFCPRAISAIATFEALQEFEKLANQKPQAGKLPVRVVFLPMRPDQLEAGLAQGLGDIISQGVVITPEREQRVAFSVPVQKNVARIVVPGSALANVSSFDDLASHAIYVNPLIAYYH